MDTSKLLQGPGGGSTAGGQSDDANRLRQYWHVVLERRWLIITTFTVVLVLGIIYALRATPIYEARAVLQIDPESGGVLSFREVAVNTRDQDYLQTQYRNLMSRSLIEKVMRNLRLDEDERYKKEVDPIEAVTRDITISPVRLTRLVEVKVRHPNPERAQAIANSLLDFFLEENKTRKTTKALEGYRMLATEARTQETELTQAIQDLHNYRVKKGTVALDEESNVTTRGLIQARDLYEQQRAQASAAANLAEDARRWKEAQRDLVEFGEIARDPLIMQLKGMLTQRQADLAAVTNRYRSKHDKYIHATAAVEAVQENLTAEAERAYQALISRMETERGKELRALNNIKAQEKDVEDLLAMRVEYDILRGKRERAEEIFKVILAKAKEYSITANDFSQNMNIIDPAVLAVKPVKPNRKLVIAGSLVFGLGLALGLALFINYLDDSVKSQDDVENYLRLPFLGYIPNIRATTVVERVLQSHVNPTSSAAEGFRTLRAAVSLARNADKLRCVAVSSTIPSEGKSLVASNFAIVTAQTGLKTLLVDCDLRRPSVHKAFQLQSPVGLAAYLAERVARTDEIIHTSDVPNLDIVCCGAIPSNPSELIGSKRMVQFLEEVGQKYDRIVLDCPPVSAVADPLVTGAMADGLIFVTKFNKIRREHAQRSVQRIQDAGIHMLGLVLNDIDFEGKDSYYYSYHYYQNRYYASHYRTRPDGTTGASGKSGTGSKKPASNS